MAISHWIRASRLRTLPLASACVLVGGAVSFRSVAHDDLAQERFWLVFALVLLDVLLLQVVSNWANDWGDFEHGADDDRRTDRAVASGAISSETMRRGVMVLALVAFIMGVTAVVVAWQDSPWLTAAIGMIVLGGLAILAAIRYTAGSNPYGYLGLGDVMVLIFFGWVGVMGSAFMLTHAWSWTWLLPATWCGLLSTAVLNLNNMRDHEGDAGAGKRTLVVRMGWARAKWYHLACLAVGWAAWWVFAAVLEAGQWRGLEWLAAINAVHAAHAWRVWRCEVPADLDPELKKVALSTAVAALFMLLAQTAAA